MDFQVGLAAFMWAAASLSAKLSADPAHPMSVDPIRTALADGTRNVAYSRQMKLVDAAWAGDALSPSAATG